MTTKGWEKELKDNCIKRWGSCVFTPRCHEFNELKDFIRSLLKAQRKELVGEIEKTRGNDYHNIGIGELDYHEKSAVDAYVVALEHRLLAHLKEREK